MVTAAGLRTGLHVLNTFITAESGSQIWNCGAEDFEIAPFTHDVQNTRSKINRA